MVAGCADTGEVSEKDEQGGSWINCERQHLPDLTLDEEKVNARKGLATKLYYS